MGCRIVREESFHDRSAGPVGALFAESNILGSAPADDRCFSGERYMPARRVGEKVNASTLQGLRRM